MRSSSRGRSARRSRSPSPMKSSNVRESRLESTLKATEEERDYYRREFELQVNGLQVTLVVQMSRSG